MDKLISMVDFVLEQISERNKEPEYDSFEFMEKVSNYAKFLKQPLTLGMFVPCDLDGNVLEIPHEDNSKYGNIGIDGKFNNAQFFKESEEYQEAKERVLFEGWEIMQRIGDSIVVFNDNSDIIEFINYKVWIFDEYQGVNINELYFYSEKEDIPFRLTESAKKQIGL